MSDIYVDPVLKKYRELIESSTPGTFKAYYYGDPILIPKSNLPALVLSKAQTRAGVHSNAEDEYEMRIILTVVTDIRDEMSDDKTIAPGIAQLYDIIEGRNADYTLKDRAILNILRSNIHVDSATNLRTDLGTITTVDYGLTIGKRERQSFSVEGQLEFVANFVETRA